MLNQSVSEARAQGRAAAEQLVGRKRERVEGDMRSGFQWATISYPILTDADLRDMLPRFAEERLASDIDLTRYPECRGMMERVRAQREGFAEVITDPLLAAFYHDWYWFCSRRLNTRFVAATPPPAQCMRFLFADTAEGGIISAGNIDDVMINFAHNDHGIPETGPEETHYDCVTCVGGVSSAVLCDDEPECLFPVQLGWIMPAGTTDLREYMEMMARYADFWGPGNQLYIAPDMTFAAVEKANVRMGVRYSSGWGAITACAYLTPDMFAFKQERAQRSFEVRGWTDDNPDAAYWKGCEERYRRLLELCEAEHKRGATLLGAAAIALDHAAPLPERICLAGERGHKDEVLQNWTQRSDASVVSGPNRRMLFWTIDPNDPKPVYHTPCHVRAGVGLESRQAEWEAEVKAAGEIGG